MAERDRAHVVLADNGRNESYQRPPQSRTEKPDARQAPADRAAHGRRLVDEMRNAEQASNARRNASTLRPVEGSRRGMHLTFESSPGLALAVESLDIRRGQRRPEVEAVKPASSDEDSMEVTVFVPEGSLGTFLRSAEDYISSASSPEVKNAKLLDPISSVRLASLRELWTDDEEKFPEPGDPVWWEIWLRRRDGEEVARLRAYAEQLEDVAIGTAALGFRDRIVVLVNATVDQLSGALDVLDDLAELRSPHSVPELLVSDSPTEQSEWAAELHERVEAPSEDAPAVTILDTGVWRNHPLLRGSLSDRDCHVVDVRWPEEDRRGHGTQMAGLALYLDFGAHILSTGGVLLEHRLESVKVLPDGSQNRPDLYGAIMADAVGMVEIEQPDRNRVYCIPLSATDETSPDGREIGNGQPSSWAAALDALAAGQSILSDDSGLRILEESSEASSRLFVVSTGNIREGWQGDHLGRCDIEQVEPPGQSWNCITVGAHTDKDSMIHADPNWDGWSVVAQKGELSPFSRTSLLFDQGWPAKPDVVLEGGNLAASPSGTDFDTPDVLRLLTTAHQGIYTSTAPFTTTNATSAATAQAAAMCAEIMASYPASRPETVRGLLVHSAEWTPSMLSHFSEKPTKAWKAQLRRRYGMGVPSLERALRSATDALTLVTENCLEPFDEEGRMGEMAVHNLPWPVEVLRGLGAAPVKMRATLSYFVEPNPARRGWRGRYNYSSHGLRFDVRRPYEGTNEFRERVNEKARTAGGTRTSGESDSNEWFFGVDARATGSLITDIWTGTAVDLAARGCIAVYPVTGWWKNVSSAERKERPARYSLIVSIETPGQDVDVYSSVAAQVQAAIST